MMMNDEDAVAAATVLRRLLEQVEAGEVESTSTERAYLAGAADAISRLAGQDDPAE